MFSGGIDVALAYRTLVAIINDSLSKRTINVVNRAAKWTMVFKL